MSFRNCLSTSIRASNGLRSTSKSLLRTNKPISSCINGSFAFKSTTATPVGPNYAHLVVEKASTLQMNIVTVCNPAFEPIEVSEDEGE